MAETDGSRVQAPPRLRLPPARLALGVLLLAMAAGQLSDLGGFIRVLAAYDLPPGWASPPAVWALVAAEGGSGLALLRGRRPGGALALVVALVWTALGVQAFARGLPIDNCGCFGVHFGQRLRWWVFLEDAELLALAAFVRRAEGRLLDRGGRDGLCAVRAAGDSLTMEYGCCEASFLGHDRRAGSMRGRWSRRPLMCPEVARALQSYLDDEIDELKAQRIARHLEGCRRCGMKAETYRAIKRSLQEHRASVPAETIERLRAFGERLAAEGVSDDAAEGSSGA